jgi:hypothetical protein
MATERCHLMVGYARAACKIVIPPPICQAPTGGAVLPGKPGSTLGLICVRYLYALPESCPTPCHWDRETSAFGAQRHLVPVPIRYVLRAHRLFAAEV